MTAPQDYLVPNGYFGMGVESTWDTPVVPGFWIPYKSWSWDPTLKWLPDDSTTGSPAVTRDLVPGVNYSKFSLKHNMYLDSIGNQLRALLGGTDTVTGTASPYTHTVKLLNNSATASQPPSYTLDFFDGAVVRQVAGARMPSMSITWSADGTVECDSSFVGMPFTTPSTPTNTQSTAHMVPGWGVTITVATVASLTLVSGSIDITRVGTDALFTGTNSQSPHNVFSGPLQIKGKAKYLIESGDATFSFANALAREQQATILEFQEPVSSDTLAFTMSNCQFMTPKDDMSKKWLMADCTFEGVANSTDASSGISPGGVVLVNQQSVAY